MRLSSCSCQRAAQNYLRHTALAAAITTALVFAAALPAYARTGGEVEFSEGFASGFVGEDLARFSMGNPVEPGRYNVDIHLNGEFVRRDDIELVPSSTPHVAQPCVPAPLLLELGLSDAARQAVRGKLRVYFGSSAGVGKTYAMLVAARAQAAQGVSVLAGITWRTAAIC
ncbi:hypothetical protein G6F24_014931 [Rhizopus arrhizus]|nr:hypothetical protein G6F24_014931 [Rhizopus arrhizus]